MLMQLGNPLWAPEHYLSFGKKACNLHSLICASFKAPDGFCITEAKSADIEYIWNNLKDGIPLVVRSSMQDEDSTNISNAGRYKSFIGICTYAELLQAITKILDGSKTAVGAAIVQPCIPADVSGVIFSSITAENKSCMIEATFGLGEILVSGICIPDRYIVDGNKIVKKSVSKTKSIGLHITDRKMHIGDELHNYPGARIMISNGYKALVSYNPVQKRSPCLPDSLIVRLSTLAKKIECLFSGPQDIEFVYRKETGFIFLQSRTITRDVSYAQFASEKVQPRHEEANNGVLFGIGTSEGAASGIAVVGELEQQEDTNSLILVIDQLDPVLLYKCAHRIQGIICSNGSVLCHAAIFARECKIPCVVAVGSSARLIKNGDKLEINGGLGTIKILKD